MATATTAPFEELTKTASDFVTSQRGLWNHDAWMDCLARVRTTGIEVSEDMQPKLGDLLEAMKEYHTAVSSTDDIEQAMSTVFNESVAFIERQKGVWGHAEWEDFVKTMQQNTRTRSEDTEACLGGVLDAFHPDVKQIHQTIVMSPLDIVQKLLRVQVTTGDNQCRPDEVRPAFQLATK